jgi:hypothetical protein
MTATAPTVIETLAPMSQRDLEDFASFMTPDQAARFWKLIDDHRGQNLEPAETPAPEVEDTPAPAPASAAPAAAPAATTTEDKIRAAYKSLVTEENDWVSLTRIRPLLADVPRDEQDRAFIALNLCPDVNIVPESNQKILTEADRDAAIYFGDQHKHLIWIAA